jgi:alpha-tubulin suppressor-like RCC1 family protein/uncharacterized protein YjdB
VAAVSGSGESVMLEAVAPGVATITATTADGGFTARCSVTVDDAAIHVNSLAFDRQTLTLVPGSSRRIEAALLPADTDDRGLEWTTSNEGVATVAGNSEGAMVRGVANGAATITATSADGGFTATCAVTVAPYPVPVVGLDLGRSSMQAAMQGSAVPLMATVTPPNADLSAIAWASSDTSVATVAGQGLRATVAPVAPGNATITVAGGGVRAVCTVNVLVAPRTIPAIKALHPSFDLDDYCSAAIKADGTLWTWGRGNDAILGHGNVDHMNVPTQVGTENTWRHISMGSSHAAAIRSDGTLWAWGANGSGQLGLGNSMPQAAPVRVGTASDWKAVSAGGGYTMAVKTDGTLWGVGDNYNGLIGDGTTTNRNTFVQIGAATNWVAVACGYTHTVALRTDGTLWAWGTNFQGQVGDGTTVTKSAGPVQIGPYSDWKAIAAGDNHSAGIRADGSLWTWGRNFNGEVGDGTTSNKNVPTRVGGGSDWAAVSCGTTHTVALKNWGAVYAWGNNQYGAVGDGSGTGNRTLPVPVGCDLDWVAVASTGAYHTAAIKADGSLWLWGLNSYGQIGDGIPLREDGGGIGDASQATPLQIGTGFRLE